MRIFIVVCVIVLAVFGLMYKGMQIASRELVMVSDLLKDPSYYTKNKLSVRLGARVSSKEINYRTEPFIELEFFVHDPCSDDSGDILVKYAGIKPDAFDVGRDVILEGYFDGSKFNAAVLLTQCPSKYRAQSTSPLQ